MLLWLAEVLVCSGLFTLDSELPGAAVNSEQFMASLPHTDHLYIPKSCRFCQRQLDEGEQVLDYSVPAYYPKLGLMNSARKMKENKKLLPASLLFSY